MPKAVKLRPAWKQAAQDFLAAGFQQGQIVPKAWFYTALGILEPSGATPAAQYEKTQLQFMAHFEKLRRELLIEHMIDLRNERGVGYKWVPTQEQTRTAYRDGMREVYKGIKMATRRIVNTDVAQLSPDQRKQNDEAQVRLARIASMQQSVRRLPGK